MPDLDPKSKWGGNILIISLALNVFLGGFMVARTLSPADPSQPVRPVSLDLRSLPDGVPNEIREELEENFHERQEIIEETYGEIQATQGEIERLMSQEGFDEDALVDAYEELRRLNMKIQTPMHEAMIEAARDLRRGERRAFADFTARQRARDPRDRRPGEVDGSSWSLDFEGGRVELDVDEIKKLSRLKILEALEGLEDIDIRYSREEDEDYEYEYDTEIDSERLEREQRRELRRIERRREREEARRIACEENEEEEECRF